VRVVFAAEAEIDLDAAVEYLAQRNPVAAFQLLDDALPVIPAEIALMPNLSNSRSRKLI
jgi:plasmid stabilization system protein ParE